MAKYVQLTCQIIVITSAEEFFHIEIVYLPSQLFFSTGFRKMGKYMFVYTFIIHHIHIYIRNCNSVECDPVVHF